MPEYSTKQTGYTVTGDCPHCGYNIERAMNIRVPKYGSPFRTCPSCHSLYIDKRIKEPAIIPPANILLRSVSLSIFTSLFLICISFVIGLIVSPLITGDDFSPDMPSFWIISCSLSIVFVMFFWLKSKPMNNNNEIEESLKRLEDENYVLALKKHQIPFAQDCIYYNRPRNRI